MGTRSSRRAVAAALTAGAVAVALPAAATPVAAAPPAATSPAVAPPAAAGYPARPDVDRELLVLVNRARVAAGLSALRPVPAIAASSAVWSQHLAAANGLSHDSFGWADRVGCRWDRVAENVAVNASRRTAADVFAQYMASPGHRANIMDPAMDYAGFATVVGPWRSGGFATDDALWNTQRFVSGTCTGAGAPPTATPRPAAVVSGWPTWTTRGVVGATVTRTVSVRHPVGVTVTLETRTCGTCAWRVRSSTWLRGTTPRYEVRVRVPSSPVAYRLRLSAPRGAGLAAVTTRTWTVAPR